MSELVKCATCKTEKPFSEMQTCMHAEREYSVCDMTCMIKFYKGEIKPDIVITRDLEEMCKLVMNPKEYDLYKANLELAKQLAKANERVKELEKESLAFRSILDQSNRFNPNTDKMYSSGFKDAMRLFEDIYLGDAQQALNKFAIEKKIEAYKLVLNEYGRGMHPDHQNSLRSLIEQLLKEQDSE